MKSEPILQSTPEVQLSNIRVFFENALANTFGELNLPTASIAHNPQTLITTEFEKMMTRLETVEDKGDILDILVKFMTKIREILESPESELMLRKFGADNYPSLKIDLLNALQNDVVYIAHFYKIERTFLSMIAENGVVPRRRSGRPSDRCKYSPGQMTQPSPLDDAVIDVSDELISPEVVEALVEESFPSREKSAEQKAGDTLPFIPTAPVRSSLIPPPLREQTESAFFLDESEKKVKSTFKAVFLEKYMTEFFTLIKEKSGNFRDTIAVIAAKSHQQLMTEKTGNGEFAFYRKYFESKGEQEKNQAVLKMALTVLENQAWNNAQVIANLVHNAMMTPHIRKGVQKITNEDEIKNSVAVLTNKTVAYIKAKLLVGEDGQHSGLVWVAYFYLEGKQMEFEKLQKFIFDIYHNEIETVLTEAKQAELSIVKDTVSEKVAGTVTGPSVVALESRVKTERPPAMKTANSELQAKRLATIFGAEEDESPLPVYDLDDDGDDDEDVTPTKINVVDSNHKPEDVITTVYLPVGPYAIPSIQSGSRRVVFNENGEVMHEPYDDSIESEQTPITLESADPSLVSPDTVTPELPIETETPVVKEEIKLSLYQKLRKNGTFRRVIQGVAFVAAVTTGVMAVSNHSSDQADKVGFDAGLTTVVQSSTPTTANASATTPSVDNKIENDVQSIDIDQKNFNGPTAQINETALKGSKLLAQMMNESGFKRGPGFNGDFSELNLRLTDNATPNQMLRIKEIYKKYELGAIHVKRNFQSDAATFYIETNAAFEKAGIGLKDHKGNLNINWKGGDPGSTIGLDLNNPFIREMLLARNVLIENGKEGKNAPYVQENSPQNVPAINELERNGTATPAGVIYTMNNKVENVLEDEVIELGDEDIIEIDDNEVLAASDILDSTEVLGEGDIVSVEDHSLLIGLTENSDDLDSGWSDVEDATSRTLLAGYVEDSSSVDADWA